MNHVRILSVLLASVIFSQCGTRNKITYNIPADYPKEKRKELLAALDKGRVLYKENCSECHGIYSPGKPNVANFTNTQLDNYSARFVTRDRRNHMAAIKMSPEQLNQVIAFLKYKRTKTQDSTAAPQVKQ